MPLKAGTKAQLVIDGLPVDGYVGSMAAAMEEAFINEWGNFMIGAEAPEMKDQMRLMFVAIAQGVVNHLKVNHDAFKVRVSVPGEITGTGDGTVTEIKIFPDE